MLAGAFRYNTANPVPTSTTVATCPSICQRADAIRAQQFPEEILFIPRHSRRGEDHPAPIGSWSRWGHRGDVQDEYPGSRKWTSPLSPRDIVLLGRHSGSAPPNQSSVPPDASWRCSESFLGVTASVPGARLRLRSARRMASSLQRHVASQWSPLLVQGRRWLVVT